MDTPYLLVVFVSFQETTFRKYSITGGNRGTSRQGAVALSTDPAGKHHHFRQLSNHSFTNRLYLAKVFFLLLLIKHISCTLNADLQTGRDAIFHIFKTFSRMLNFKDERNIFLYTFISN